MDLTALEIRTALAATLSRPEWQQSARLSAFLRFIVERTLAGERPTLKETVVGVEVFDRPVGYDPKIDPVVRVEARRLRLKLQEYYSGAGAQDPVRFVLPKGTYQPQFERATPPAATTVEATVPPPAPARTALSPRLILTTVVGLALLIAAITWLMRRDSDRPLPSSATPRLLTGYQGYNRYPAFSPDGTHLVYSRNLSSHQANLYLQNIGNGDPRALTQGETLDTDPAWAPDARHIAFLRQADRGRYSLLIRAVGVDTTERHLTHVGGRGAIDWTPDGSAILAADRDDSSFALFRIDATDGRKQQITSPPAGTPGDSDPHVSPDGRSIAFVRSTEDSVQDVYIASISGSDLRRISQENHAVEGIAWHPSGKQVVASLQRGGELRSLWRLFLDGRPPERIPEAGVGPISPALPARGDQLAYVIRLSDTNVWHRRLVDGQLTDNRAASRSIELDTSPQLSPDGKWLAWRSTSSGTNEVWIARADGSEARQLTHMNGPTTGSAHWSPDAKWIVFDSRPANNGDIFRIPVTGGTPTPLTREPSNEVLPSYSIEGATITSPPIARAPGRSGR